MPIKDFVKVRNLGAPVYEIIVIINFSSEANRSISQSQKSSAQTTGVEKFTGAMRTNREQIQSSIPDYVGDCGKS